MQAVAGANDFTVQVGGRITGLTGLTAGAVYYLDDDTAGLLTTTEPPDVGDVSKPLLIADTTTSGWIFNMRGFLVSAGGGGGGGESDPIEEVFGTPDDAFEFDSSSLAGLTALTPTPDDEDADTTIPGHYYVADNASGVAWCGRYIAKTQPFTIIAKLSDFNGQLDSNTVGVFVGAATPGNLEMCGIRGADRSVEHVHSSDPSGGGLTGIANSYADVGLPLYLAIRLNGAADLDAMVSFNGRVWRQLVDGRDPGYAIGACGILLGSENANGCAAAFDFFRVWDSALTFPGVP